jgi:hypothetical protein
MTLNLTSIWSECRWRHIDIPNLPITLEQYDSSVVERRRQLTQEQRAPPDLAKQWAVTQIFNETVAFLDKGADPQLLREGKTFQGFVKKWLSQPGVQDWNKYTLLHQAWEYFHSQ